MFLANLEHSQKKGFLDLAHALIASDGVLAESEISTLELYKQEMNLNCSSDEDGGDVKRAITVFETASVTVKKQIVFELIALACVDQEYAASEDALVTEIRKALGIEEDFAERCKGLVKELTDLYAKIGELVNG